MSRRASQVSSRERMAFVDYLPAFDGMLDSADCIGECYLSEGTGI